MATYFHGVPEIQGERLQTLYLMNPSYVGYSDAPAQANMDFFDSPDRHQRSEQHLVGIPIEPSTTPGPHHSPLRPPQGLSLSLSQHHSTFAAVADEAKIIGGSKYLKAAQQLLEELVNVGKDEWTAKRKYAKSSTTKGDKDGGDGGGVELTAAERHELQMNKAKLVSMLEQVEQRHRQYQHQMQILVSSFEAAAGFGSARSYTVLALRTVSKQFRCLHDAISCQIRSASRSLGEDDCSRLRFADHHLRRQRALRQLGGAVHYNAWRPQRGLPEHAVSVLRAWLFEHFLHPYPKDSDKHMLAKETGLTRSQVSNWFINARVRLWKPMIEEMYLEESKEQEHNNAGEKTRKSDDSEHSNHDASPTTFDDRNDESFVQQQRPKMKFVDHGCEFGAYQIGGIGRFDHEEFMPRYSGNGVSLTLGLPHCELQAPYLASDMGSVENNHFSLNSTNGSCYQTM